GGRHVRVLNFASGGYKQPQQILVLAYYLSIGQPFDAIVNIDGYNEMFYAETLSQDGLEISFPGMRWDILRTADARSGKEPGLVGVSRVYYEYLRKDYSDAANRCRLGSCWLLDRLMAEYLAIKRRVLESEASNETTSSSESYFQIRQMREPGADLWNFVADRW